MKLSTLDTGPSTPFIKTVYIADKPLRMLIDSELSEVTFEEFHQRLEAGEYAEVYTVETAHHEGRHSMAAEVRVLLHKFQDVLPEELPDRLPSEPDVEHGIALRPGAVPAARAPFRHSPVERASLATYVAELLRKGWIKQSDSPWTSSIFAVPKKDPAPNFANMVPRVPLSRIDDILDTLQGAKIFSCIDLTPGYHQMRLKPGSRPATAFQADGEPFQWVTLSDHVEHLRAMLTALRSAELYANPKKCTWAQEAVVFLGHPIANSTITLDPAKTATIRDMVALTYARELQRFLGLCGYYRRFLPAYAELVQPLSDLLKQSTSWTWGLLQTTAFERIKDLLQRFPVLQLPDFARRFFVTTDASDIAVGGVLSQVHDSGEHPVAFLSRKLSDTERRWPAHEKELYAIKFCLGKTNVVADALYQPVAVSAMVVAGPDSTVAARITALYSSDPDCQHLLQRPQEKSSIEGKYSLNNGLIVVRDGRSQRILLPRDDKLLLDVLIQYHDEATVAHPGVVVRAYLVVRNKTGERKKGLLQPLPIPDAPWVDIAMDFVTGLPTTGGFDAVLVVVCRLSKRARYLLTRKTADAEEVARSFLTASSSFTHVEMRMTVSHRAQADGQSERQISTLEDALRCMFSHYGDNWNRQAAIDYAKDQLSKAQARQKRYYNKHRNHTTFELSDFVYVRAKLLNKASSATDYDISKDTTKNKLLPRWVGPFPIAKRVEFVRRPVRRAAPVLYDNQGNRIYVIAALLQQRRRRDRVQYLVKWADLSDTENSWENVGNISKVAHWYEPKRGVDECQDHGRAASVSVITPTCQSDCGQARQHKDSDDRSDVDDAEQVKMPPRRVTRRETDTFLQRLKGKTDFGDDEQKDDATTARLTTGRRPRMTVVTSDPPVTSRQKKKKTLSSFYDLLAKTPRLHGKAPAAALYAEEVAEIAANVESENDDEDDADYVDVADDVLDDDDDYDKATTPPATPRSKASAKGKDKRKRGTERKTRAVKQVRAKILQVAPSDDSNRSLDMATSPDENIAPFDQLPGVNGGEADEALNSDYEDSDAGSAEWYEDVGVIAQLDGTPAFSDEDSEPRYYNQELAGRMDAKFRAQSGDNKLTLEQILANEKRMHSRVRAQEILQCLGLLLALPTGTFGRFKKRERFERIMRNLHFSDNTAPAASTDKAWKVRPIVETLQRTFRSGYRTPPIISFDEAMVPSRSKYNPMRQFVKDKPHRWGTKLFMSCCAQTAYCLSSGPAATLRNMNEVLPPKQDGVFYAVVTDRFYTSIQISLQLLARNVYSVGTIQTRKNGFPPMLKQEKTKRPRHISRGTTKFAVAKSVPQLSALVWFDNTIVYLLGSGTNTAMSMC
ncbi:Retrotransposable element, partial [Phytophthora palmivora]